MKKFKLISCLLLVVLLITGCKDETIKGEDNTLTGAWTISITSNNEKIIPKNALSAFNKAIKDYDGLSLEPYALLGSQVVNGTNYMFIAVGTTMTSEPIKDYKIVIVYEDLDKNAEITKVEDFNIEDYANKSIQFNEKKLEGGWNTNSKIDKKVTKDDIFNKASSNYDGVKLSNIMLLGTQIVNGTNYAYLAVATTTTKENSNYIALVTIYEDLEKNVEINDVSYIDLANFNK